jgi:hypothetical protein
MKAAMALSTRPPLERMEKRIRLATTPPRREGRSSRMKGSPPARTTFMTPRRPSSSKKASHSSAGRSSYLTAGFRKK